MAQTAGPVRQTAEPFLRFAIAVAVACAVAATAAIGAPQATQAWVVTAAKVAFAALAIAGGGVWLGSEGVLAFAPVLLSFFLLNRFDEGWALPVGGYLIKANYWFGAVCAGLLAAFVLAHPSAEARTNPPLGRFTLWFALGLAVFVLLAILSAIFNAWLDPFVPNRSMLGEILAIGSLTMPMLFTLLLPLSSLSKEHVLWCVRGMVALAAGTGFIMVVFAILPQSVAGLLGWAKELGGSGGLVRGSTPLGHANTVAAVQMLFLPVAVVLGLRRRSAIWTPFYLGCAAFLLGGILFSQSRTALAITIPVLGLCFAYLALVEDVRRWEALIISVLAIVGIVGVGTILFSLFDFSRFWSGQYYEDANVERRVQTMHVAVRVFEDHPLLGVSPNSVYPRDELDPSWIPPALDQLGPIVFYRGELTAGNAHNLFLNVLTEYGVLGGGVFFSIMALAFHFLYRCWRDATGDPLHHARLASLALAYVSFLGAGLGGALFLYSVRIGLIFWIFLGLAIRYGAIAIAEIPEAHPSRE